MEKIRILIWGFGAIGSGMADMLLEKEGVEIVGVCDKHIQRVGRNIFDLLECPQKEHPEIIITDDIDALLSSSQADLALLATDSFIKKAQPKIIKLIKKGLNVISTAEEMSYPWAQAPQSAREIDAAAKEQGVSVLGTGINPGLIMDMLVILLTGVCRNVHSIKAKRVNSLSPFGPTVMEEQGVGLSPKAFEEGIHKGTVTGHVGFPESIQMIADGLGWKLSGPVEQSKKAIITSVPRKTQYTEVNPGQVAGCDQRGVGYVEGVPRIQMIHPQQIEPKLSGTETGDYISIQGEPPVNMAIQPEIPGGLGTIAMCVNMIPQVINASPGLKTMLDLPIPRAIMGDMRDRIGNST